jgi:mono/diheme cytochrome c family protein
MRATTLVTQSLRIAAAGALIAAGVALDVQRGEAHKAITSKYTYNDDVFPIFRERCARCHVPGGVAPMSLMTYDEAFPWAESIRAELVAAHMPPWNADDGFGELKRAHTLTSKELDVIMTWASGGNPRGALDQKLPRWRSRTSGRWGLPIWRCGLPSEFTVSADAMEATQGVHAGHRARGAALGAGRGPAARHAVDRRSAVVYVKRTGASAAGRPRRIRCWRAGCPGRMASRSIRAPRSGCRPAPSSWRAFTTRRRGNSRASR